MTYLDALDEIIRQGIEGCKSDYANPRDAAKREGSMAGFEACRGKSPKQLSKILGEAQARTQESFRLNHNNAEAHWRIRCFEAEVEWVCNVASAILLNQGKPVIIPPTCRGALQAARIVGVKSDARR